MSEAKQANAVPKQGGTPGTTHVSSTQQMVQQIHEQKPSGVKSKSQKSLRELKGAEQKRALKMMKKSVLANASKTPFQEIANNTAYEEYQKASSLYEALKLASSSASTGFYNFSGCHSIVRSEKIGNQKRAIMVTKDLRKIAKIPFKYDVPLKKLSTNKKARSTFSCTCASSVKQTLASSAESSRKSLNSTGPSDAVDGDVSINQCGGSVIVTVQNDDSHFLGIPGQQIIVEIVH